MSAATGALDRFTLSSLSSREFGGQLALPIWVECMQLASTSTACDKRAASRNEEVEQCRGLTVTGFGPNALDGAGDCH
jgi:hypothetical protein